MLDELKAASGEEKDQTMTTDTPAAAAITAEMIERAEYETDRASSYFDKSWMDVGEDGDMTDALYEPLNAVKALSAPVAAQPAASGVDALWADTAKRLVEELETAAILYGDSEPDRDNERDCLERMLAAREALRAHLSTALTGAATKE